MNILNLPTTGCRLTETVIRTDIPVENVFYGFKDKPFSSLLNSSLKTDAGRYSYMGVDPFLILTSKGGSVEMWEAHETRRLKADPFEVLSDILSKYGGRIGTQYPFAAGGIGYFAYELKNHIENLPQKAEDDIGLPDMFFPLYRTILVFDGKDPGKIKVLSLDLPGEDKKNTEDRIQEIKKVVAAAPASLPRPESPSAGMLRSNFSKKEYLKAVENILEHIQAGNIYQACLTQRFMSNWEHEAYDLYLKFNDISPAPFSAFLNCGDFSVISASPELFLKVGGGRVETRPMKGTRPRGSSADADKALGEELLESKKDAAELLMIVDLERNDLGKVCRPGTIEVSEHRRIEAYPSVFQTISVIQGGLKNGIGPIDVLKAAFPGGSISGCPKIRSLQILDDLEPTARGVYTGAIGYISLHDTMELSVAIRTMTIKGKNVYFHAGGGIVSDSDPEKEYEETLVKARAMMEALGCLSAEKTLKSRDSRLETRD